MSDSDDADYIALTQKLLNTIITHGNDGVERTGIVGGFVDPKIATDALAYCIAAFNSQTSDCATPMGQRQLADSVRADIRRMMKTMVEEGHSPFATVERVPRKAN